MSLTVLGLTKGNANSYADYQIRINAICPGYLATPLIKAQIDKGSDGPLAAAADRDRGGNC